VFVVLVGADDGQEGVGTHREGYPAQPGGVAADLVLIQAGEALAGLEGLLDLPAGSGEADWRCTPTVAFPFFTSPVSSTTRTACSAPR